MGLAHRVAGAVLLTLGALACGACSRPSAGAEATGAIAAVEPPVAAPDGLLAEVWVRTPDATWQQVQEDVGGVTALLPPSCAEAAAALSGLDVRLARLVDGKRPFVAVLASGASPSEVGWAAALPLTDPTLAAATLPEASDVQGPMLPPRSVAGMRVLAAGGVARLETVALAGQWLVVASTEQDLARLGPYAARTMPTKVAPGSAAVEASLPAAALAGVVSTQLLASWAALRSWLADRDEEQRAAHGGRAPDFADPRAILDAADGVVHRRIGIVATASAARIELGTDQGDLRADVLLTPGPDDTGASGVAALRPGTAQPLAQVPAEAVVAILSRDDAAGRAADAREIEATVDRALGGRARPEDTAAVHAAVDDWARERGDWITASLAWGGDTASRGLWLRTPAAGDGASRALRELVELSHRQAFAAPLSGALHATPSVVAEVDVPSVPRASLATFTPCQREHRQGPAFGNARPLDFAPCGGDGRPHPARPPSVAWGLLDGDLLVAAGAAATRLLAAQAAPDGHLSDDPRTARLVRSLGADVVFAVIARPLRFDPARAREASSTEDSGLAPALLALGRRGGDAWLRVELGGALVRELVRLKASL